MTGVTPTIWPGRRIFFSPLPEGSDLYLERSRFQGVGHRALQLRVIERLRHEIVCAAAHRGHDVLDHAESRDHDHGKVGPGPAELLQEIGPFTVGQFDIEEDEIRRSRGGGADAVRSRFRLADAMAPGLKFFPERPADQPVVVDDLESSFWTWSGGRPAERDADKEGRSDAFLA